uniref:Uncharacterized protein n=1 Tax=Anguilla anguilla TaxID=7936 RepID=A0A0E9SU60_ANGAN
MAEPSACYFRGPICCHGKHTYSTSLSEAQINSIFYI